MLSVKEKKQLLTSRNWPGGPIRSKFDRSSAQILFLTIFSNERNQGSLEKWLVLETAEIYRMCLEHPIELPMAEARVI